MYASEQLFDHLRLATEVQLLRELEHRRVARERASEATPPARRGLREFTHKLRELTHHAPRPLAH
ncbi:hypothetical protein [Microbacterium terricola]|uniref:Uncharacterized protein n=1 Tax=Microbacterium terricola TaxID=344163 RepID=A0ABM8E1W0_9MICO|nr:hypothetical protein [Microbacterium terricola]UYK40363.1 hypothetical protein OAU46_01540 [Microbacterium terricola]BDV31923.1 hypothetical protein Microterr_25830 [Microbacterium terricola]